MTQDGVVLLHGIFRTSRSMERFRRYLAAQGFATLNLDYPSTSMPIETIRDVVTPAIVAFSQNISGRVHFVGHSMGGLVIRRFLAQHAIANVGRVVMLGTPNQGSEIADFIANWWLYKKLYGPAGQQLTTHHAAALPVETIDYELGILAGNRTVDPFRNYLIGAPSDGTVSIESTILEGMKEHCILKVGHLFFPLNRSVWEHTVRFLHTGSFT